jgi:topoisomerase-4 subunit A
MSKNEKNKLEQLSIFDPIVMKRNIDDIMADRFGRYAKYIIQDRALADVRDGLKPVQRRILYAMNQLGLTSEKQYKKSARTVGEVIGKYHPHGDSSIYEAMVRMSQDWKNNLPLLDIHGNNGSIDGDSAAAMRYTEARLSKFTDLMLLNIDKNTVTFAPNFDDSEVEPTILPSQVPNLLVNGVSGIAAGYATNIPPHNLAELIDAVITRIDSPNCRLDSIMKSLKGPDLPTGAIIQGIDGIRSIYETGRGRFVVRSKIELVNISKSKNQLIVTEIPFEVSKSNIVKEIDQIRIEQKIQGIEEVRDETDRSGLRIVIDLTKDAAITSVKNYLLKNTSLQVSYNANMIAIVNRKPVLMTIFTYLDNFIEFQVVNLVKTTTYDLNKATERLEILTGLIKAIKILDDVVDIIRRSNNKDEAKTNLQKRFAFTERQSEAIVQLRLYRLTSTDVNLLNEEAKQLEIKVIEYNSILGSKQIQLNYVKNNLRDIKKQFDTPRKSSIEEVIEEIKVDELQTINEEKMTVIISNDGYIKSVNQRVLLSNKYEEIGLKPGDLVVSKINSNTLHKVVILTTHGNFVTVPSYKIKECKWKEIGVHLNEITTLDAGEKVLGAINVENFNNEKRLLAVATKSGLVKVIEVKELDMTRYSKTSTYFKLSNNDTVIDVSLIDNQDSIGLVTKIGYGLTFKISEVNVTGPKASGVKGINLETSDELSGIFTFSSSHTEQMVAIIANNGAKRIHINNFTQGSRANKGKTIITQVKSNPINIVKAISLNIHSMINISNIEQKTLLIKATEIPIGDNETKVSSISLKDIVRAFVENNY